MNQYMITIKLPNEITEDFVRLIPKQRQHINRLMDQGKIAQYSLSIDRSIVWVTMQALSEREVMDILANFPLIGYMKPEIQELAFFNSVSNELPKLIMN
ncbi:MAG: hypothetical protein JWP12_108 [Bacteroidetes bacterium]|nr:hypothetical protein [Bacteroidota bacterium]